MKDVLADFWAYFCVISIDILVLSITVLNNTSFLEAFFFLSSLILGN